MSEMFSWAAVILGMCSAAAWWGSTFRSLSTRHAKSLDQTVGKDGDTAFQLDDGTVVENLASRVAMLNAIGALFAGFAVASQAVATMLSTVH